MTNTPKPADDPNQEHFVRGLPFKAHKIEGFTPELLERYYEDTYGGSIRTLNEVETKIAASRRAGSSTADLGSLIAKQANLADLIALQEVFLAGLAEDGGDDLSDSDLAQAINATFGNVAKWREEFAMLANADGTPPDWVVLAWCERFGRLQNVVSVDGPPALCSAVPILAMHLQNEVYTSDFGDDRHEYVNIYLQNIHWERVAQTLQVARVAKVGDDAPSVGTAQVSVAELSRMMESDKDSPLVLDVRHDDDCERYTSRIAGTDWRDSFKVADWAKDMPKDRPVVVYCMYGFWVSQKVAEELRAEGVDALSLDGGVVAWRAMGLPSVSTSK